MEFPLRTPLERVMSVPNIPKEMYLLLLRENRRRNRMHGCISPPLIIKPALSLQELEERTIRGGTPKVHISDLKIRPEVAKVVGGAAVIREEVHRVTVRNVFGVEGDELFNGVPESRDGLLPFEERDREAFSEK